MLRNEIVDMCRAAPGSPATSPINNSRFHLRTYIYLLYYHLPVFILSSVGHAW